MSDLLSILEAGRVDMAGSGNKHHRPGWKNVICPFCGKGRSTNYLLGFNLSAGYAHCYSCGPKRLGDAIAAVCNISLGKAIELTKDISHRGIQQTVKPQGRYDPPKGIVSLMSSRHHKNYVRERRLDPQILEDVWKVGAIKNTGRHSWRVFIPLLEDSCPVSWTTRTISSLCTIKYLSASASQEKIEAKSLLYGEDFAGSTILIQEGAFGVWTIGPGSVATLGTGFTPAQFARMTKYPKRFVCFDNEPAAQKRARQLVLELNLFPGKTWNIEIDAKDTNEASEREKRLIRKTVFGD